MEVSTDKTLKPFFQARTFQGSSATFSVRASHMAFSPGVKDKIKGGPVTLHLSSQKKGFNLKV